MFNRNQLVHAVFWPLGEGTAFLSLLDTDGVVQGEIPVNEPLLGSEVARKMPDGFFIEPEGCTVHSMSGKYLIGTPQPFDTAVVTERAQISDTERLDRLETTARRYQQRQTALEVQNNALRQRLEAAEAVTEPTVSESEPSMETPEVEQNDT